MPPAFSPIPWKTIEDDIFTFFQTVTLLNIQWRNQKAPRQDYPYGVLGITRGPSPIGVDENRQDASTPELLCVGNRDITTEFSIFGAIDSIDPDTHARAYVSALVAALEMPLYKDPLSADGIAVRSIIPINLPDEQIADTWVSRAVLDVVFGISSNTQQPIDLIEHVTIQATPNVPDLGTLPLPIRINTTIND